MIKTCLRWGVNFFLVLTITGVMVLCVTQAAALTSQAWPDVLSVWGEHQLQSALSAWWWSVVNLEFHPLHPLALFALLVFATVFTASQRTGARVDRLATTLIVLAFSLFCLALTITAQLVTLTTWDGGKAGAVLWRLAAVLLALFACAGSGTLATAFQLAQNTEGMGRKPIHPNANGL